MRKRDAFTLIELLVTIAVIGVLVALSAAGVGRVRQKALDSQCVSNLRSLGGLLNLYVADHGNYPGAITTDELPWYIALDQYSGKEGATESNQVGGFRPSSAFRCPARGYGDGAQVGYGYNYAGFGYQPPSMEGELPPDLWFARIYWKLKPAQVTKPAIRIVIGDSFEQGSGNPASAMYLYQSSTVQAHRHHNGGNYLWADGHVEWAAPDDLWYRNRDPERSPYFPFPRP